MTGNSNIPFQLKADFVPLTVLKLTCTDLEAVEKKLQETIKKAPGYFTHAPIVIDAATLEDNAEVDLAGLQSILKNNKMFLVGVRGLPKGLEKIAQSLDVAKLKTPTVEMHRATAESNTITKAKPQQTTPTQTTSGEVTTRIITKPVRAGAQVYAKGGDLVILAGVNPGAECFADGNIHVYGPLRGRALAGANGNTNARIFCKSLEAELVAIAGHYAVQDNIKAPKNNQGMVQVYLTNDQLHIDTI